MRGRRGARRVPQAAAAQLLGVRREALLRALGRAAARCSTIAGVQVGVSICEDAWSPRPILAPGRGRRGADRQHQRVAVLRGPAARTRGDARRPAPPRRRADRLREPRRRPGRARVRRRVARVRRAGRARRRASSSRKTCSSSTSTSGQVPARLLDPRVASLRRGCRRSRSPTRSRDVAARASSRVLEPAHEIYEALVLGTRDYVREERLHRRAHQPVGRHRLVAGCRDRRRRARPRARARRDAAVALFERRQRRRRRRARGEPRHRRPITSRSSRRTRRSRRCSRRCSRARARPRRGEPAGAHPRQRR